MKYLYIFIVLFLTLVNTAISYENNLVTDDLNKCYEYQNIKTLLFKPSKFIIGEKNKVTVKGKPDYFVSVAYSEYNSGAPDVMGIKLRLGREFKTIEKQIPKTGVVEIEIPVNSIFEDKDKLYLEALCWSKNDFSDIEKVEILDSIAQKADLNAVVLVKTKKNSFFQLLNPAMEIAPGVNTDINDTIDAVKKINNNTYDSNNYIYPNELFYEKPSMFMNINAPELLRK